MIMRRSIGVLLAGTLLFAAGCSDLGGMATRYRAERMHLQAQREEARLTVGKARPDSTTLLKIHDAYSRLRATFKPPFVKGTSDVAKRLNAEITRQVGGAELTGARFALQARRPDLALEHARWVASIAEADTGLHRQADFISVGALRAQRKFEDAIQVMRGMLQRYRLIPPPSYDREDQLLSVPDGIVGVREEMGDSAGARRERAQTVEYYRGVLKASPPPILQAQVRARLARTLIEMGDAASASGEVTTLRRMVSATPALKDLEPEIMYTEARVTSMGKDTKGALELYDLVLMTYPHSRFAPKALFDSGILLERLMDREGALARYRAVYDRPNADEALAPIASFRAAMVKDQMGKWAESKQMLEGIPVRFPHSRAAIQAPFAIVEHYSRAGQGDAVKASLLKAVDVYRGLIASDTTSVYCAAFRWSILRAFAGLERWNDALAAVDEMVAKDRGILATAQALVEGAKISSALGDKARSDMYLQYLVTDFPSSPVAAQARKLLKERAFQAPPGKSGGERK